MSVKLELMPVKRYQRGTHHAFVRLRPEIGNKIKCNANTNHHGIITLGTVGGARHWIPAFKSIVITIDRNRNDTSHRYYNHLG